MRNAAPITQTYGHVNKFMALLVAAECNAKTAWEINFVTDIRERFEQYRERLTMTPLQRKQFNRLSTEE
ncbi:hypothetical protein D9M68_158970 [compost metagenome]